MDDLLARAQDAVERGAADALVVGWTSADGGTEVVAAGAVTPTAPFAVASITKVVTAAVARAVLGDDGLDAPSPLGGTVRMLLGHTAGVGADAGDLTAFGDGDDALSAYAARLDRVERIAPPGVLWSYGNPGYWLVGHLVEQAAATTFARAVREHVLDVAGMPDARLEPWCERADGPLAADTPAGPSYLAFPRARVPSGGLRATAADVLALARACWPGGPLAGLGLLGADGDTGSVPSPGGRRWAPGWEAWRAQDGRLVAGHGGVAGGYRTRLWSVPEARAAVVVLGLGEQSEDTVLDLALEGVRQLAGAVEPAPPDRLDLDPARLSDLAGAYARRGSSLDVRVDDGGALRIERSDGPTLRAHPVAPDRFLAPDGVGPARHVAFLRDGEGAVGWIRAGLVAAPRVAGTPGG